MLKFLLFAYRQIPFFRLLYIIEGGEPPRAIPKRRIGADIPNITSNAACVSTVRL